MGLDCHINRKLSNGEFKWVEPEEMENPVVQGVGCYTIGYFRNPRTPSWWPKHLECWVSVWENDWTPWNQQPTSWVDLLHKLQGFKSAVHKMKASGAFDNEIQIDGLFKTDWYWDCWSVAEYEWALECMIKTAEWVCNQDNPLDYYTWWNF